MVKQNIISKVRQLKELQQNNLTHLVILQIMEF
jgi:hypothetical protein